MFSFFPLFFLFPYVPVVMLPPWVSSFFQLQLLHFSSSSFCSSYKSSSSCSSSSSEVSSSSGFSLKKFGRRYEFLQNGVAATFVYYLPFLQEYIVYSPSQIYHILFKKCLTLFEVYAIIHTSKGERPQERGKKLWQLKKHFVTAFAPSIPKH